MSSGRLWPSLASRLDYIRGTGYDLEETPLFRHTIPTVLIFFASVQGDDLDEYDLDKRGGGAGLGERIIISSDEK